MPKYNFVHSYKIYLCSNIFYYKLQKCACTLFVQETLSQLNAHACSNTNPNTLARGEPKTSAEKKIQKGHPTTNTQCKNCSAKTNIEYKY